MHRHANKLLGQHFLKNKSILRSIIELLELKEDDSLIEIGPGNGEMTLPILKNSHFSKFIVIEKDKILAENLKKLENPLFEVFEGDALQKLPQILEKTTKKVKVFGNLPYYLTGQIFRILWEYRDHIEMGVFMIQKEVAERMIGAPGEMNRLAAFTCSWSNPKIAFFVNRKEFSPQPKVDSAVVVLTPVSEILPLELSEMYEKFIKLLFAQPRKKAINNLSELFSGTTAEKKKAAELFLETINIKNTVRPQDINISSLISLTRMLYNESNGAQNT
jgi:16S rRNA (adenine1518-N6/adenine1519-N6)-dimethyltransferase